MIPAFDDTAPFVFVAYGLVLLGWCLASIAVFRRIGNAKSLLERELTKEEDRGK